MLKIKQLFPLCTNCLRRNRLHSPNLIRTFSSSKNKDLDFDEPIKYSDSLASKYKAENTRTGIAKAKDRLWYEPYVILGSISIFLLYFCVLREENDIDRELNTSLYSRIEGLEEHQLKLSLRYNEDHRMDTSKIIERLEELEQQKIK